MSERESAPRLSRAAALGLWIVAALGLLVAGPLAGALLTAVRPESEQAALLLTNLTYYLPFVGLPLLFCLRRRPELGASLRPGSLSLSGAVLVSALALAGVFFVNDLTILWCIPLQELGLNLEAGALPTPAGRGELALMILSTAALPALFEEFLFRGAIFSALEMQGARRAAAATALLFALMHGSLAGLPAQLLLGLVLAALVLYFDSIYASIIYHTVHNAAALILSCVQSGQAEAQPERYLEAIGGAPGVAALLINAAIYGALMLAMLRAIRRRARARGVYVAPARRAPLRRGEWGLVAAVAALALALYALDLFAMLA